MREEQERVNAERKARKKEELVERLRQVEEQRKRQQ